MSKQHLHELQKRLPKRSKQQRPPVEEVDSISIVDMIKTAYEKGLFRKLRATDRKHADTIDFTEIDSARLKAYFSKRPEFNEEPHLDCGIYSVEYISDEFDIEIYDNFMSIYRLVD